MFADYVFEKASAAYSQKMLLIDTDNLQSATNYCEYFETQGFQIIRYEDDLHLRAQHEDDIYNDEKVLIIAHEEDYIPYDIRRRFTVFNVTLHALFPNLNTAAIREEKEINYDLLSIAYKNNFDKLTSSAATKDFIKNVVNSKGTVQNYLQSLIFQLNTQANNAKTYHDWMIVSTIKSTIDVVATEYDIYTKTSHINDLFVNWVLNNYGKLSAVNDSHSPVIISRTMEFIKERSDKFVIVVMDGMSEFDWKILSNGFNGMHYDKANMFAMIPTTTSISRQCLLSNKFPSQLEEPWKQSKEKNEFFDCAISLGYTEKQIGYERGYDAEFSSFVKCAAVIINEIDDTVHGQQHGRIGMFSDINIIKKQAKLVALVKRLLSKGFDVYITADHGNTLCTGDGRLMGTGVETETKSRRMIVLKEYADKEKLIEQYNMIEYPKYYLNKDFDYLICAPGRSFDVKDETVMSHGGITVDEVIIPFITIKAGDNNG